MSHIVESCPLTKLNGGLSRLHSADEDAVSWLTNYGNYGKWHAYEKKKKPTAAWCPKQPYKKDRLPFQFEGAATSFGGLGPPNPKPSYIPGRRPSHEAALADGSGRLKTLNRRYTGACTFNCLLTYFVRCQQKHAWLATFGSEMCVTVVNEWDTFCPITRVTE